MSLYPTQMLYKCLLLIEVSNWGELAPPIFNKLMSEQTLMIPVSIFCSFSRFALLPNKLMWILSLLIMDVHFQHRRKEFHLESSTLTKPSLYILLTHFSVISIVSFKKENGNTHSEIW